MFRIPYYIIKSSAEVGLHRSGVVLYREVSRMLRLCHQVADKHLYRAAFPQRGWNARDEEIRHQATIKISGTDNHGIRRSDGLNRFRVRRGARMQTQGFQMRKVGMIDAFLAANRFPSRKLRDKFNLFQRGRDDPAVNA